MFSLSTQNIVSHLIAHGGCVPVGPVVWLRVVPLEPVGVGPESHSVTPGECSLLGEVLETNEGGLGIGQPRGEALTS